MAYTGTVTFRGDAGASGTSSGATGSFTPSSGETLIAWVLARNASAYPTNSISDSLSGTWTRIGSADFQGPASNAFVSVGLFRRDIGGSPASMTVTGTSSNGTTTAVAVVSATALGTITNFAGYSSSTTPNTGTLTGAAILTYNGRQTTSTVTTPTGYTALMASTGYNAQLAHRCAWDTSSPGTQNWGTGNNNVTVSLELVDASGAATQDILPSLFTNTQTFYAATVTPGAVTLNPPLVTNSQTFHSPTITQGAAQISPTLFVNVNIFYSASLTGGQQGWVASVPAQGQWSSIATASTPWSPSTTTVSTTWTPEDN